jgi:hypothetical protein
MTQYIIGYSLLLAPVLGHFLFKPRFWIAASFSLVVVFLLSFILLIFTESFLQALTRSAFAGAFTFAFAMPVGLVFRMIFSREYIIQEEINTHSKFFILRSRVVGFIATFFGLVAILVIIYQGSPYPLKALLGGIMFLMLGIWYLISKSGGATHAQFLVEGKVVDGETSNLAFKRDAEKRGAP